MAFFEKLKRGVFITHTEIIEKMKESMTPDLPIDRGAIDGLEEGLLGADVGAELTTALVDRIEEGVRNERITKMDRLTEVLREETRALIPQRTAQTIELAGGQPVLGLLRRGNRTGKKTARAKRFVVLVVGVNGTGKTTTIAKLAARWKGEGKSVILGAADTFRAAAIEQLQMWADRIGVPMIKHKAGSDPGAVAHDAVAAAVARGADVVVLHNAGRLDQQAHLMQELAKVRRVIEKELPGAPHETLLVLDGTTGQNGVNQAAEFLEAAKLTGMVGTKLAGTAKGGVILSIMRQFDIPVKFIGVGEGVDDLIPFDPAAYVDTLF